MITFFKVTHNIDNYSVILQYFNGFKYIIFYIQMDVKFKHNFCESRLNNYQPPELWNAYTSFAISVFPFILKFPKSNIFYNIACMLSINGFASFYYHYYLSWYGKQADEITMILANYYGIWGLLKMYYFTNKTKINWYNGWNSVFMVLFLVINTVSKNDYMFPNIFGFYLFFSIYLIYLVANKNNYSYKRYLFISSIGGICWIISENHCTEITKYGHVVWHFLFPLGFYRLIINYDNYYCEMKKIFNNN